MRSTEAIHRQQHRLHPVSSRAMAAGRLTVITGSRPPAADDPTWRGAAGSDTDRWPNWWTTVFCLLVNVMGWGLIVATLLLLP